jgi:hypothetical protein
MLIEKPTAVERSPARMKGQRNLRLSEKCPESNRKNTVKRVDVGMGDPVTLNWINSPATAYGGTVSRLETVAEYPNPWMIEGKKKEIP